MARGVGSSVYLIARNFTSSVLSHNIVSDYRVRLPLISIAGFDDGVWADAEAVPMNRIGDLRME
jgi:UPF0288 family protein (methanogenesis marker protein 3)